MSYEEGVVAGTLNSPSSVRGGGGNSTSSVRGSSVRGRGVQGSGVRFVEEKAGEEEEARRQRVEEMEALSPKARLIAKHEALRKEMLTQVPICLSISLSLYTHNADPGLRRAQNQLCVLCVCVCVCVCVCIHI